MSPTRFPWLPMLALAICLLGDMYISSSLFSYVGYMVQALGVVNSKDEAGYYVGFLASASMLGRFSTSYLWGRFADRYGRLMVIYIGLVSTAVFSVAFGLSTTFWWALGCRILLGAMSGIMGISKTMVSEVCSKENEAVGMGVITASWSLSLVLGPGVAGLLTEPARNFPRVFSDSGLFGRYPCLLPNLVGAGVALMGLLLVILFLSETANLEESSVALVNRHETPSEGSKVSKNTPQHQEYSINGKCVTKDVTKYYHDGNGSVKMVSGERGELQSYGTVPGCSKATNLLAEPHIRSILYVYGAFAFINCGLEQIFPLWALSTVAHGGLDWTTKEIGQILSVAGVGILIFEMIVKPIIVKRLDTQRSQRWSSASSVLLLWLFPFLTTLRDAGLPVMAASILLLFLLQTFSNTIYVNISLAVNNAVKPSRRGEINGLALTVAFLSRSAAPVACTPVFAWSINHRHPFPFNSHLIYILLGLGMLGVVAISWNSIVMNSQDSSDMINIPHGKDFESIEADLDDAMEAPPCVHTKEQEPFTAPRKPGMNDEKQGLIIYGQNASTYNAT